MRGVKMMRFERTKEWWLARLGGETDVPIGASSGLAEADAAEAIEMTDPLSDLQRLGQEFDADVVIQADRDAAADLIEWLAGGKTASSVKMRIGAADDYPEALSFARHRFAAIEAARPMIEKEAFEKAAKVAERLEADDDYALGDGPTIATAVRALGDRVR